MAEPQTVLAWILGLAMTLFLPVLVWVTVILGLIHIVREKVRENRNGLHQSSREK